MFGRGKSYGVLFVVFQCAVVAGQNVWSGPSSEAVVVDDQVTLSCRPPVGFDSVDWYHTPFGSVEKSVISRGDTVVGNSFKEFFSVVNGDVVGQFLTLSSAKMRFAGVYACSAFLQVSNGTGRTTVSTAHLTVLETIPLCTINQTTLKEGDSVGLRCKVTYNGFLVPVIQWYKHRPGSDAEDDDDVMKDGHSQLVVKDNTVTSVVTISADYTLNNSSFSCKVFFQKPSQPFLVNASNAPGYNYTWKTPLLQVHFGPKDLSIQPQKSSFEPGDVLTCVAKSSPAPSFQWKNLETEEVFEGSELFLRRSMEGHHQYSFSCRARNELTDSKLSSAVITFQVTSQVNIAGMSLNILSLVFILVSAILIIVIMVLVFHILHLKRSRNGYMNGASRSDNGTTALVPFYNTNANYSEYSEIPAYSTCQEAMERCNSRQRSRSSQPPPPLPPSASTAPAYLPMTLNNSVRDSRNLPATRQKSSPLQEQAYANGIYMEPDGRTDASPRYSAVVKTKKSDETPPKDVYYSDLDESKDPNQRSYTTLSIKRGVEGNHEDQSREPVRAQEAHQTDYCDYLEPISTS